MLLRLCWGMKPIDQSVVDGLSSMLIVMMPSTCWQVSWTFPTMILFFSLKKLACSISFRHRRHHASVSTRMTWTWSKEEGKRCLWKVPIEFDLEECCVRVEITANAAMVILAAATESGAEAAHWHYVTTQNNTTQCNATAVLRWWWGQRQQHWRVSGVGNQPTERKK